MNKPEEIFEQLAELADEIIFFCEKTTVLAEKVFHPAASGAQLTTFSTCWIYIIESIDI